MAGGTPDAFDAECPAKSDARADARFAIYQARALARKTSMVGLTEDLALTLLGYGGTNSAALWADVKRTAILGNVVSRELLRQDEADKRAKIGERR